MSIGNVAKLAGVSISTVSRVINNHPRVDPETARIVRDAMAQLNYTPSDRRPGPKPYNRAQTVSANVAFLVFGTNKGRSTPAFEELLHGVSAGVSAFNLNLVFANVADVNELPPRFLEQKLDGLILHGSTPGPAVQQKLCRFPTVWLMGGRRRPDWGDQVMPDAYEIGDQAARYLMNRGHKRLAYLNLDAGHWPFKVASQSFQVAAIEGQGVCDIIEQPRQPSPGYWPSHSASAIDQLLDRYFALPNRPTGLMIADDMQTAVLQPALQQRGVKIGMGQTEIISCNNEKPYLIGLNPRPAVIDIRVEAVGRRGVEQLMWRIEHRDNRERLVTAIEPFIISHEGQSLDRIQINVEEVK